MSLTFKFSRMDEILAKTYLERLLIHQEIFTYFTGRQHSW